MGDERAIEPLKLLVAEHGRIQGRAGEPESETQERLFAAKMALIRLGKEDRVSGWLDMLRDPSLTEFQLAEVVNELNSPLDPRATEPLLELVKSNPPRAACRSAINALSQTRSKDVVAGLIDCFDIPLTVPPNGSDILAGNPFQEIAATLHALTGVDFGADKGRWKKWWDGKGKDLPSLH